MTSKTLPQPRFQQCKALRALAFGLAIGFAVPAFADNLPEVQRLIKQGQYPQALEKLDSYLSTRPKDAQGRFLKGLIYTEMNKPTEAIGVFTKLTEDYPELPEPYNNLAVLYAQQKNYEKARLSLEMAIRTHPSYAIAYENLGDIYAKLASQAYDKALHLDTSNAATQNKLALIRNLITTSGQGNVKPVAASAPARPAAPSAPAEAPVAARPAPAQPAPTASIVSAKPGAAATQAARVAEAKPAEMPAKPAATPEVKANADAPSAAASEEVAKAIAAWASAWSHKDMKAYFAAYVPSFDPSGRLGHKSWEAQRRKRIAGKSGQISISYDEPKITIDGDKATARFRQHYKSRGFSSSSNKTLDFVRSGGKWLIQDEDSHR